MARDKEKAKMPRTRKKIPLGSIEDPIEREKERKKRRKYRKQNWRRYSARRYKYIIKPQREKMYKKTHEEHGYYAIYLTKRKKKDQLLKHFRLKNKAMEYYKTLIEENDKITFEKETVALKGQERPLDMEIILVRRTTEDDVLLDTAVKNEWGETVRVNVTGNREYVLLDKHKWKVEETFYCYGYHPVRNRKTYDFIFNEWILGNDVSYDNTKRINMLNNKLIIRDVEDFNFVVCRDSKQTSRLYDKLMSDCDDLKIKNVFFLGDIPRGMVSETYQMLYDKTGWERTMLYRTKT